MAGGQELGPEPIALPERLGQRISACQLAERMRRLGLRPLKAAPPHCSASPPNSPPPCSPGCSAMQGQTTDEAPAKRLLTDRLTLMCGRLGEVGKGHSDMGRASQFLPAFRRLTAEALGLEAGEQCCPLGPRAAFVFDGPGEGEQGGLAEFLGR
jgi:hypothetical protein